MLSPTDVWAAVRAFTESALTDPNILKPYLSEILSAVTLVLTGLGTVAWFFISPAISNLRSKRKARIRVRVIRPSDDRSFDALFDLYQRRIDYNSQIDVSLIRKWYSETSIRKATNNTIIGAYSNRALVGFMQIMWSLDHCALFVTYLVIDDSVGIARTDAAKALIGFAVRKFSRRCSKVIHFIFEVEKPDFSRDKEREKAQRDSARIKRLKLLCRDSGLWCGEIDADYIQPEMPNEAGISNEHPMRILIAGRESSTPKTLERRTYVELLRYLYFGIYARVYEGDPELAQIYADGLERLIGKASDTLPESLRLL